MRQLIDKFSSVFKESPASESAEKHGEWPVLSGGRLQYTLYPLKDPTGLVIRRPMGLSIGFKSPANSISEVPELELAEWIIYAHGGRLRFSKNEKNMPRLNAELHKG